MKTFVIQINSNNNDFMLKGSWVPSINSGNPEFDTYLQI